MKPCLDKQCSRLGEKLPLSEFPRNQRSDDGRYIYCKECCRRRSRALRAAKGAREYRRRELAGLDVDRKPMILANGFAFSKVYDAIQRGLRTREQIHKETGVDYDTLGEVLVELVYDCKAVKIEKREFVLAA